MKIYFCDICNQSIPIKDIDEGAAVAVRQKLICASCNGAVAAATRISQITTEPGSSSAAPGPTPQAMPASPAANGMTTAGAVLIVAISVLASSAVTWFMVQNSNKRASDFTVGALNGFSETLTRMEIATKEAVSRSSILEERIAGLAREQINDRDAVRERERVLRAEVESRFEEVRKYVRDNEATVESVRRLEMGASAASDSTSKFQTEIAELRRAILELTTQFAKGLQTASTANANNGPAQGIANPAETENKQSPLALQALPNDLAEYAKKLKSPDPGQRWDAVEQLARSRDPRVVAYLVPMLSDTDGFVRDHSAAVLADIGKPARVGVPFLIDALGDAEGFVRESAYSALRKLTDQNVKFEAYGKPDDRAKQQKAWRTWWTANGEKFVNG